MSKMMSLQLTEEEAKKMEPWKLDKDGNVEKGSKLSKFPGGTMLHLDDMILSKLGMSVDDFKTGEEMQIAAKVVVDGTHKHESLGEDPKMDVQLQITMMAIREPEGKSLEDMMFKDA